MNSNRLAPFTKPKDEALGKWLGPIHGGIVCTGINIDELDGDIQAILSNRLMTEAELVELCNRLEKAKLAVNDLYDQIERFMPSKTVGQAKKLKGMGYRNSLLSMFWRIFETRSSFNGGIDIVRKRVMAILKRREKEAEANRIEALDKEGMHQQMEISA